MQQNKGYIIINGFLREEKFFSLYSALKQSADKAGLQLELKTNIELMCDIASGKTVANETLPPFAIFWDKDVRLAKTLEAAGMKLFNSASAINPLRI